MAHRDVYEIFKKMFPTYAEDVTEWFPNGKSSVRVRNTKLHRDYVFTYVNADEWRFETVYCFAKSLNKK